MLLETWATSVKVCRGYDGSATARVLMWLLTAWRSFAWPRADRIFGCLVCVIWRCSRVSNTNAAWRLV